MNRVWQIGRLTADPELKYAGEHAFVNFTIAVDERVAAGAEKKANFFRCTAWRQSAEFMANYCAKGEKISVDGRLQQREYTNKEGVKVQTVEIVVDQIEKLEWKKKEEAP